MNSLNVIYPVLSTSNLLNIFSATSPEIFVDVARMKVCLSIIEKRKRKAQYTIVFFRFFHILGIEREREFLKVVEKQKERTAKFDDESDIRTFYFLHDPHTSHMLTIYFEQSTHSSLVEEILTNQVMCIVKPL